MFRERHREREKQLIKTMNNDQKPQKISSLSMSSLSSPPGRNHPNLRALDVMKLTYPGWIKDKQDAEDCHYNYPSLVQGRIDGMKRKQTVYGDGDRSHPNLVTVDSVTWTYSDWKQDKADVEQYHCDYPTLVNEKIQSMQRKQKVHDGDRSHPDLVTLDTTNWTYHDWTIDKEDVEDCHFHYPSLVAGKLQAMQKKQQLFDGSSIRSSHPDLVALDNAHWTYEGWENDKKDAENLFFNYPAQVSEKIATMHRKQTVHNGDRSHPNLVILDSYTWTFTDWKIDKENAEHYHLNYPSMVNDKIQSMQRKQKVYNDDRSHSDLVTLDATHWSYSGWEKDKADCEDCHFHYPTLVTDKIKGMQRKQQQQQQQAHNNNDNHGSSSACPIVLLAEDDDDDREQPARKRQKRAGPTKKKMIASRMPTQDTSSLCVVCLKAKKTHAFDSCQHVTPCVCQACSTWALQNNKANPRCPYCSRPITYARAITATDDENNSTLSSALIDLSTNT